MTAATQQRQYSMAMLLFVVFSALPAANATNYIDGKLWIVESNAWDTSVGTSSGNTGWVSSEACAKRACVKGFSGTYCGYYQYSGGKCHTYYTGSYQHCPACYLLERYWPKCSASKVPYSWSNNASKSPDSNSCYKGVEWPSGDIDLPQISMSEETSVQCPAGYQGQIKYKCEKNTKSSGTWTLVSDECTVKNDHTLETSDGVNMGTLSITQFPIDDRVAGEWMGSTTAEDEVACATYVIKDLKEKLQGSNARIAMEGKKCEIYKLDNTAEIPDEKCRFRSWMVEFKPHEGCKAQEMEHPRLPGQYIQVPEMVSSLLDQNGLPTAEVLECPPGHHGKAVVSCLKGRASFISEEDRHLYGKTQTDCTVACDSFTQCDKKGRSHNVGAGTLCAGDVNTCNKTKCCAFAACEEANATSACSTYEWCSARTGRCDSEDTITCPQGMRHNRNNRMACSVMDLQHYCSEMKAGEQCIKGLYWVGKGFDITESTFDIVPFTTERTVLKHQAADRGVGSQQELQGSNGEKLMTSPQTKVVSLKVFVSEDSAKEFTDTLSYQASAAKAMQASGRYGKLTKVEAEASISVRDSLAQDFQQDLRIVEKVLLQREYQIRYDQGFDDDEEFLSRLKELPESFDKDSTSYVRFEKFIQNYGTHFVNSVTMGGKLIINHKLNRCEADSCTAQQIEAAACGRYDSIKASGEVCGQMAQAEDKCVGQAASQITTKVIAIGGSSNACSSLESCEESLWKESVKDNMEVIEIELRPLWEAVPDKLETQYVALKLALEDYVKMNEKPNTKVATSNCPTKPPAATEINSSTSTHPSTVLLGLIFAYGIFSTRVASWQRFAK